jgi:hypothetical protein
MKAALDEVKVHSVELLELKFAGRSTYCIGGNWNEIIDWLNQNVGKTINFEMVDDNIVSMTDEKGVKILVV